MINGPLRYSALIKGHELVSRRDLIPSEPDHPRAGNWYYALQLGPLEHKLPPIVSNRWRRVTFIVTSVVDQRRGHRLHRWPGLTVTDGRLPMTLGDQPSPASSLRFAADTEFDTCLQEVKAQLRAPRARLARKMATWPDQVSSLSQRLVGWSTCHNQVILPGSPPLWAERPDHCEQFAEKLQRL